MKAWTCSILVLLGLFSAACPPIEGPVDVEAIVADPSAEGGATLATVTLKTVSDLFAGRGERFDIRGNIVIPTGPLTTAQEQDPRPGRDTVVEETRLASNSDDMAPRSNFDGERWVAQDMDTLMYFTAFHAFESVWDYYDDVIGDDTDATDSHALVGMYGLLRADTPIGSFPRYAFDNAAYVPHMDAWILERVAIQFGVPYPANSGVIAHEFGHRHFSYNVTSSKEDDLWWASLLPKDIENEDKADAQQRSHNLYDGFDEGLADLFAVGFTRDPDWAGKALENSARELEGDFATFATFDKLETEWSDALDEQYGRCGSNGNASAFEIEDYNFYCVGTVFARAMWEASGRDVDVLRDELLPNVRLAMQDLGPTVQDALDDDVLVFEAHMLLQAVAARMTGDLQSDVCAAFLERFESQMEEVTSCP